jgi:hypothetical protein
MPVRTVPQTDLSYHLISFDEDGRERRENDGSLLSEDVRRRLADPAEPVTDVFVMSHGWKGDIPAAIEQYDRWLTAMAAQHADRAAARALNPDFRALVLGLHWPSQPWGDEELPGPGGLLSGDDAPAGEFAEPAALGIADTPAARAALHTIVTAVPEEGDPITLSPQLREAYQILYAESGLAATVPAGLPGDAVVAPPGFDRDGFDPEAIIKEAAADAGPAAGAAAGPGLLGLGDRLKALKDLLLMPVRQLSFWKMKDRARHFGEGGAHSLIRSLRPVAAEGSAVAPVKVHLMGHSFGCIVVTGAVAGPPGGPPARPVESLFLVQGALSLWSMCPAVPYEPRGAGYFHSVLAKRLVKGPILTTRSDRDTAVGRLYPRGAQLKKQFLLDPPRFPQYGGVGAFGLQGLPTAPEDLPMRPATHAYGFRPGGVYNLEASRVIVKGEGLSGAHSDIAHPQVAHAMWQAVLSGMSA